jgi:1-acyl-sn-glycerol-3-phosphate acyltransferase
MDYINFRLNKMPKLHAIATSLRDKAYGIFAALTFTAVTIPTIALMLVIPGETNRRRVARAAARLTLRLAGTGPSVVGLENLPAGACVVVANHASYLDGVILTAVLPPRFTFVIKREMTEVPFAHFLLRRLGSEFVDRDGRHRGAADARRILQKAEHQRSLAFFPEGTFGPEPGLRRFHNGAFAAARRGDLPVAPVIIRGSRQILPANRLIPVHSRIKVIIKPIINPQRDDLSPSDLRNACRQCILEDLDEPDMIESPDKRPKITEFS